jgi:hypothetical protein
MRQLPVTIPVFSVWGEGTVPAKGISATAILNTSPGLQ